MFVKGEWVTHLLKHPQVSPAPANAVDADGVGPHEYPLTVIPCDFERKSRSLYLKANVTPPLCHGSEARDTDKLVFPLPANDGLRNGVVNLRVCHTIVSVAC